MDEIKYRLKYTGGEADYHRLPAHAGAESLEGMTWAYSVVAHYAATGKIKSRGSLDPGIKVFIRPARPGSFETDILLFFTKPENLFLTSIFGVYTVTTASQAINALIVNTFKLVCGVQTSNEDAATRKLSRLPSGDREALADKLEPSFKRAHNVINEGAKELLIKKGYTPLLTMDGRTKAYVNADILGDELSRRVSIGSFNANTGNGSAYLSEIGKTVPFKAKDLDAKSRAALSYSLDQYVNERDSDIEIACQEILTVDQRVKKLVILRAFKPVDGDLASLF
jgi:hypothetical protein